MGARTYLPSLGIFTVTDPVEGGNDTTYGYPCDPVNQSDLSGNSWWGDVVGAVKTGAQWLTDSPVGTMLQVGCGFAKGIVGAICGGVFVAAYAVQGRFLEAAVAAVGIVVGGYAAKAIVKAVTKPLESAVTAGAAMLKQSRKALGLRNPVYRGLVEMQKHRAQVSAVVGAYARGPLTRVVMSSTSTAMSGTTSAICSRVRGNCRR